ncbi:MAG: glycosyltransferase family 4 protein, partial [Planctomycetota bacterium]
LVLLGGTLAHDGRSIRIVRSLSRAGEVDVLGLDFRPEDADLFADGVRLHSRPGYDFRPRGIALRLRPHRRFDGFAEAAPVGDFDLVLAVGLSPLRPAARLAEERGAKLVYELREPYPWTLAGTFRPATWFKQAVLLFTLWSSLRAAMKEEAALLDSVDLTVLPGGEATEWFRDRYGAGDTIEIEDFPPRQGEVREGSLRRELGIPETDRVVMDAGPLSRERSLTALVRAASTFPDGTHLVIVGRGSQESRLRLFADAPDLAGRVHFTGPVPEESRPEVVAAADLGVDLGEDGPGALHEFMAAGVPVLARETSEHAILVRHDAGWLTSATASAGIADAVNEALRDPAELRRRGGNGRRSHRERFHWEAEEKRLLAAIPRQVLSSQSTDTRT